MIVVLTHIINFEVFVVKSEETLSLAKNLLFLMNNSTIYTAGIQQMLIIDKNRDDH